MSLRSLALSLIVTLVGSMAPIARALMTPKPASANRRDNIDDFGANVDSVSCSSWTFTSDCISIELRLRSDSSADDPRNPTIAAAFVVFVLSSAILISSFWIGPAIQRRLLRRMQAHEVPQPSFGFGFEGLTKKEMDAERRKEMAKPSVWFIKLPARPPILTLKQAVPLTPIQLDVEELHKE